MACGKPVVSSRLATGADFVNVDGVTGIKVDPRDPGSLSEALNLLVRDPALRFRMGRAAKAHAESEFSLKTMRDRTLALYRAAAS
jgi:glycosyltransferase involved in cell wall biosynthesis